MRSDAVRMRGCVSMQCVYLRQATVAELLRLFLEVLQLGDGLLVRDEL